MAKQLKYWLKERYNPQLGTYWVKQGQMTAANAKLKKALEGLICWIGVPPEGPSWATPEAKARNKAMFDAAMQAACDCFPEDYNGISELTKTN
jgi:hypothetical protein